MIDRAKWKKRAIAILSLDNHPGHIAAGFALGVFISFTPFFGLHTPMALVAAFIFRLNKITCITGAWINTPLTVVPVLAASYGIGFRLLGEKPLPLSFSDLSWKALEPYAASLLVGSSILGFVAACLAYLLCYRLVLRFRRTDPSLAEITRESLEVGEDLEAK